jgi:SAM-dependent methyltransferase
VDIETRLAELYRQQSTLTPLDRYLHAHARNRAVQLRHVKIFERYAPYLEGARTVLDWGSRNAADACMIRMRYGSSVELHACDVDEPTYNAFYDFGRLHYTRLDHPYRLPYEDGQFDAVIGSGVLEHVPIDSMSLIELYRAIKPGGHLIITFLPNRCSYTEWLNRQLGHPGHLRLYSLRQARGMLIHSGFLPVSSGYHQIMPSLSSPESGIFDSPFANWLVDKLAALNAPLEAVPLVRALATNIFAIGRKVYSINSDGEGLPCVTGAT